MGPVYIYSTKENNSSIYVYIYMYMYGAPKGTCWGILSYYFVPLRDRHIF